MDTYVFIYLPREGFVPAAKLTFDDQGRYSSSLLDYGRRYLHRPNAIAIDPLELPLNSSSFRTQIDFPLFSAIRDAGPDRWGQYLLGKKFGRTLNDLEYVLAAGPHRTGALAFGPDVTGPAILTPSGYEAYQTRELDLALCLKGTEDALANSTSGELSKLLKYGPSIGGARPKAPVTWCGKPHLAKFSVSLDTRNEPLIEFATMQLATLAGLDVPSICHEKILGRDVYLIERFDRLQEDDREHKIHFLSGLTMMQCHEADRHLWSYPLLCQAINKFSDRPQQDLKELFKRMIFNILVNNDDDHPRNHGFIHVGENRWQLSKLYDVVPRDQRTNTFRLAMIIGEKGKVASKENALSARKSFGLSEQAAMTIWRDIEEVVVEKWQDLFAESGLSAQEIESFRHSIGMEFKV